MKHEKKFCSICTKPIPVGRQDALPETTVCVNCSFETPLTEREIQTMVPADVGERLDPLEVDIEI